jgi:glutamate/tyrosine decarboxylase-like PLP-dependent enzyme
MRELIDDFSVRAKAYLDMIDARNVFPSKEAIADLKKFDVPLQETPMHPSRVVQELDDLGAPATVASAGGRYFGFVIGGALPAALAANLMAGVWDQNAGIEVASPVSSFLEEVCRKWLVDILNLPACSGIGFVTGATVASFCALAAARHALLAKVGWNAEEDGLFGAPPINVIVGDEVHVSVLHAFSMLGLGRNRIIRVPVDNQGRMKTELILKKPGPTIICLQAGNVNTGAFDPADSVCRAAREMDAWVYVDGAFGLWAMATPERKHLTKGIGQADSWATDAHKWMNVPFDSGIVFVRDEKHLASSMSASAAYLIKGKKREPQYYVPELSRRARGIEVWAALRSLGKNGLRDLINRNCECARLFAERLKQNGIEILNDVVLNQVLVSFGDAARTNRVIKRVQEDGTCWCGGTVWQNRTAMRISVSSWKTTEEDVIKSADVIARIAAEEK